MLYSSPRWTGLATGLAMVSICRGQTTFDWGSISPSEDLVWTDCYGGTYRCARLEVPYDYSNTSDTRTMALALQMLPAVVVIDDPAHSGSVFINPGGPGHPGTEFLMSSGSHLQLTFDKEGERHYDIIGWDTRGVGETRPKVKCMDGLFDRDAFYTELRGTHAYEMNSGNVAYLLALFESLAAKCEWQADNNADLDMWEYLSTALVVEDLVRMVDKLDEQRAGELAKRGLDARQAVDDTPRLQYYGASYGSVIGQMFASVHPERVGRILIDGIVDVEDYLAERGWLKVTADTDVLYEEFFDGCFAAAAACALYLPSDASAAEIEARVWEFMESLDKKPRGVVTPTGQMTIIRGQDLSTLFGVHGYSPIGGFQHLANVISAAMYDGDWDPFFTIQEFFREIPKWEDGCPASGVPPLAAPPPDFIAAILCSEAGDVRDKDVDWWLDYALEQEEVSKIYGHNIVQIRLSCNAWPFRAAHTFDGPFTHPPHDYDVVEGKPAAPLLILNTRVDPVAPASAARDAADKFPGAGLIIQDSFGHVAILAAPSNCTDEAVRDYFHTGIVPEGELSCPENCGPWDPGCSPVKTPSVAPAAPAPTTKPSSDDQKRRAVIQNPTDFTKVSHVFAGLGPEHLGHR